MLFFFFFCNFIDKDLWSSFLLWKGAMDDYIKVNCVIIKGGSWLRYYLDIGH